MSANLYFHEVRWKNFMGTGNYWNVVALDTHKTTCIVGANGAGKSTLLDAIVYALFGEPYKDINKPECINEVNGRELMVEIGFSVGAHNYYVKRGDKPRVFEIYKNGVLVDQDAKAKDYQEYLEQNVLRMNRQSFCQVVILGSTNYVPFMKLSTPDRREIVEHILDIEVFTMMNEVAKKQFSKVKDDYQAIAHSLDLNQQKQIMYEEHLEELRADVSAKLESWNKDIAKLIESHEENLQKAKQAMETATDLRLKAADLSKTQRKQKRLQKLEIQLEQSLKSAKTDAQFFSENDVCPVCDQAIPGDHRHKMLSDRTQTAEEIQVAIDSLQSDLKEIKKSIDRMNRALERANEHESAAASFERDAKYATAQIESIERLKSDALSSKGVEAEQAKLDEARAEFETLEERRKELEETRQYYNFILSLLKDSGIKSRIISQYIPIMNRLINRFLQAMSSSDFNVTFTLDENFKERIAVAGRKGRSYDSFSAGQQSRMNLALLFTWREIARMKNSVNTNLLVFDEVFDSSLDAPGTEDFLNLIHELGEDTNVIVISHKKDVIQDKFDNSIRFVAEKGFSYIKEAA